MSKCPENDNVSSTKKSKKEFKMKGKISLEYDKSNNPERSCDFSILIPLLQIEKSLRFHYNNDFLSVDPKSLCFLEHLQNKICFIRFERTPSNQENYRLMEIGVQQRISLNLTPSNKTISYTITFLDESKNEIQDEFKINHKCVDADFERLWKDGIFSDFILKCEGGGEFKIHKTIVSIRSEVFAKMFKPETLESKTGTIKSAFDQEVMCSVLEFIYTGKTKIKGKGKEVFVAADYYQLPRLKLICKVEILKRMTVSNAISILCFADSFVQDVEDLKRSVLTFIRFHSRDVVAAGEIRTMEYQVSKELLHIIMNALVAKPFEL